MHYLASLSIVLFAVAAPADAGHQTESVNQGHDVPPQVECGTDFRALARHARTIGTRQSRIEGSTSLVLRDPFGAFSHTKTSAHFAVKWNDDGVAVSEADVDRLLEALEFGWTKQVDELGFIAPSGTDTFFLNVYLGNTGGAAPPIEFPGGYVTVDFEGFSYIVLAAGILSGAPDYSSAVAVHELFHTVQLAELESSGAFAELVEGWSFLLESGANWAEERVYPENPLSAFSAAAFHASSRRALDFESFEPDVEGSGRHYGAYLLYNFLDEHLSISSTELLKSWMRRGRASEAPLAALKRILLSDHDLVLGEAMARFGGHNAVWDYQDSARLAQAQLDYAAQTGLDGAPVSTLTDPSDSFEALDGKRAPENHGYVVVALEPREPVILELRGATVGSQASDATWYGTIVDGAPGAHSYTGLDIVNGQAEVALSASPNRRFLVLSPSSAQTTPDESFDLEYRLRQAETPLEPGPAEEAGGGCRSVSSHRPFGGTVLLLLAVCLCVRRHRCRGLS